MKTLKKIAGTLFLLACLTNYAVAQEPKLDVPYVPTRPAGVNDMLKMADVKKGDVV